MFNSCTLIEDLNEHKIPMPPYKFPEFSDIKQGKVHSDVVVDIIEVFHELGYTQTVAGNKKIQVNFTLKDLNLPADQQCPSQSLFLTCQSQMLSQSSSFSQLSGPEKFMQNTSILPIERIIGLSKDRECNELLGKTAAELQLIMAVAGVTNPLEHPLCLDTICGRTFAFRAKWQPLWDTCSVQALKEDDVIVKNLIELFPKNEEPCQKLITTTTPSNDEGTSKLLITTTTPTTVELKDIVSLLKTLWMLKSNMILSFTLL
ncbi:hypothetical protein TSUD_102680 [Trifolium subterraneum]|uniref:Uncharacterized protein n=1 Tax=Trifolium subterraneum TaxID=3900 RepID=A0A2Z6NMF9_TRISU|nr:hypothetical protein TSUD_102680 [Trifolium subterraneum]